MIGRCACLIIAIGSSALLSGTGEAAPGAGVLDDATGESRADSERASATTTYADVQQPPAKGNPLRGVPISALAATRERPVFSPSRRPPPPPAAQEPVVEAPPSLPAPAATEQPPLTLMGTVIGDKQNSDQQKIAVIRDQRTNTLIRVRAGEEVSGWVLLSIEPGSMTIEKNSQSVTVALPAPGTAPPNGPMVSQALPSNDGAF
jgi:general secretion pathway protein N